MEWGVHNNESKAVGGGTGQNTLWQNLPNVKSSGILKTLNTAECKYQEVSDHILRENSRCEGGKEKVALQETTEQNHVTQGWERRIKDLD